MFLVVLGIVSKVLIFCCLKVCLIIVKFLLIDDFVDLYCLEKKVSGINLCGWVNK